MDKRPSLVYTVKDISEMLLLSRTAAYELCKSEGFPLIKIRSAYRIPIKEFHEWCRQNGIEINATH